MTKGLNERVAEVAKASNVSTRALPDTKGGLVPKQLQTYAAEAYSYFTIASNETQLLYSGEMWVVLTMTLETAGPVAVGNKQSLTPVLSGKGRLLDPGVEYKVTIPRGTRWYITSQTVNRVSITVEPIPWLEQIDMDIREQRGGALAAIDRIGAAIVNAIDRLRGGGQAIPTSQQPRPQLPAAPPIGGNLAGRIMRGRR